MAPEATLFAAAGGGEGVLRLAHAWHGRVMADEVVAHAFSHGFHPQHTERLAAYWGEAWGGPPLYSHRYGSESSVVRIHSGNGPHDDMDRRAVEAFDHLFPDDPPRFLARTPHGHGSRDEIVADVARAGLETWEIIQRDDVSIGPTPREPAVAYCQGMPLRNETLARDPEGLERTTAVAEDALRSRFGPEHIEGRISAVVVLAS